MDSDILIKLIVVVILVLALLYVFIRRRGLKKRPKGVDYDSFFNLGAIFLIIGLVGDVSALWTLGLVFFLIGVGGKVSKKKKTRKKRKV